MIRTELVAIAAENANRARRQENAKIYSREVRKARRRKSVREAVLSVLVLSSIIFLGGFAGYITNDAGVEQKYIVRYGTIKEEKIITEDGHIWEIEDAPEFCKDTEVRVVFDSNCTESAEDDEIIDITER